MSETDTGRITHCDTNRLELEVSLSPGQAALDYRVGREVQLITTERIREYDDDVRAGIHAELDDAVSEAKREERNEIEAAVEPILDELEKSIQAAYDQAGGSISGQTTTAISNHIAAIRKALS